MGLCCQCPGGRIHSVSSKATSWAYGTNKLCFIKGRTRSTHYAKFSFIVYAALTNIDSQQLFAGMSDGLVAYLGQNVSLPSQTTARLLSLRSLLLSNVLSGRPCSRAPGGYSWSGHSPLVSLAAARVSTGTEHEVGTATLPAGLKSGGVCFTRICRTV